MMQIILKFYKSIVILSVEHLDLQEIILKKFKWIFEVFVNIKLF